MRDPRVDPEAGDVVCSEDGTSCLVVDEVTDGAVRCRIRTIGRPDKLTAPLLAEWRAVASLCAPLAEKLTEMQREHDEHARRATELREWLAFLRGDR